MKPKLTNADFCRAAKRLKCKVAAIKAVAFVESRGDGFYANDFPVILFERHKFRSFTRGKYNASHPHLSGPAGNYGPAGQHQRNKFNEAFKLDPEAAMKSCSWGKFQIMGFNYEICGFSSVGEFVDAMKESEGKQLDAFVNFVIGNHLSKYLRDEDFASFAKYYNGADYKKNKYDIKMIAAFAKYEKENIDCSNSVPLSQPLPTPIPTPLPNPSSPTVEAPINQTITHTKVSDDTASQSQTVVEQPIGTRPEDPPLSVSSGSTLSTIFGWFGGIGSVSTGILAFIVNNPSPVIVAMVCFTIIFLAVMFRKTIMDQTRMNITSDPTKYNVK